MSLTHTLSFLIRSCTAIHPFFNNEDHLLQQHLLSHPIGKQGAHQFEAGSPAQAPDRVSALGSAPTINRVPSASTMTSNGNNTQISSATSFGTRQNFDPFVMTASSSEVVTVEGTNCSFSMPGPFALSENEGVPRQKPFNQGERLFRSCSHQS